MAIVTAIEERVADRVLYELRKAQGMSIEEWHELNPDINIELLYHRLELLLRISWGFGGERRGITLSLGGCTLSEPETVIERTLMMLDNIKLKGELFLLRLLKHLPPAAKNQVEGVTVGPAGKLLVKFKNGHQLETTETDIESSDFVATCGMVYDL